MTALESSIEKSHIWLNTLQKDLGLTSEKDAYRLLKVVLHTLRDRLPVTEAAQLGAQLPTLIRGIYYEGFRPRAFQKRDKTAKPFLQAIEKKMPRYFSKSPSDLLKGVFYLLTQFISPGEIEDVKACCNEDIRAYWPEPSKRKKIA
jgi:uncharacterized protein (DUF2267 family)